jgi:arylsulfatase
MATRFDDAGRGTAHDCSTSRCSCNRGIYHQGWTGGHPPLDPWVSTTQLPALDDDVWELYGPDDWTRRTNLPPSSRPPRAPPAAVPDRGREVTTCCRGRRRVERFNPTWLDAAP